MQSEKGCPGCGFHATRGVIQCEYCLITGQPRGCPTGSECTKRQTPEQVDKLRKNVQREGLAPTEPWKMAWNEKYA